MSTTHRALITGATAGIGAEFARQLAREGSALVLVARDADRLREQVPQLRALGATDVEVLAADLTDPDQREQVAQRLQQTDQAVDLLVNNAGMGLGSSFSKTTWQEQETQLELNVTQLLHLCHTAVIAMAGRGGGDILNVASVAGVVPGWASSYGATKSYVIALSESLAMENRCKGVRVMALLPGFVRTEFHQRAGISMKGTPGWMYVNISRLVRNGLRDLRRGRYISVPGVLYKALYVLAKLAPRSLQRCLGTAAAGKK